jgi:hypothetical protein
VPLLRIGNYLPGTLFSEVFYEKQAKKERGILLEISPLVG